MYNMIAEINRLSGGPLPGSTSDTDRIKYCCAVGPVLVGGGSDRGSGPGQNIEVLKYV
jgi:hypothetical protein